MDVRPRLARLRVTRAPDAAARALAATSLQEIWRRTENEAPELDARLDALNQHRSIGTYGKHVRANRKPLA